MMPSAFGNVSVISSILGSVPNVRVKSLPAIVTGNSLISVLNLPKPGKKSVFFPVIWYLSANSVFKWDSLAPVSRIKQSSQRNYKNRKKIFNFKQFSVFSCYFFENKYKFDLAKGIFYFIKRESALL